MEINVADLVESTAGRDKGKLFYVIRIEGVYVLLANGKERPIERPKRKKQKHIRRVHQIESDVVRMIRSGDKVLNAQLRRDLAMISQSLRSHNQGG